MNTLLMIKPDVVERGLHGEIIALALKNRFRITRMRMFSMDRTAAEQFYDVHKDREFFPSLVDYITSGPVVALEIEGENVVERIRGFIGPTNPADATPGTVRYAYGISLQNNAVHGSDSPDNAKKELAIAFGDT